MRRDAVRALGFMRGLAKPLQFQGSLRGAVQYLAWELFTAKDSGRAEPRHRTVRILTEYLMGRGFDENDAHATVLRNAGLVTTTRHGGSAVHLVSARGMVLLGRLGDRVW